MTHYDTTRPNLQPAVVTERRAPPTPDAVAFFIGRYIRQFGCGPSLAEIGMAFGLSRQRAHDAVRAAIAAGAVRQLRARGARSWEPVRSYHVIDDVPRPAGLWEPCRWPGFRRVG